MTDESRVTVPEEMVTVRITTYQRVEYQRTLQIPKCDYDNLQHMTSRQRRIALDDMAETYLDSECAVDWPEFEDTEIDLVNPDEEAHALITRAGRQS